MAQTTAGVCAYLDALANALLDGYQPPDRDTLVLDLSAKAGLMDFGFVTKGGR